MEIITCEICEKLTPINLIRETYNYYDERLLVCNDCFSELDEKIKEKSKTIEKLTSRFLEEYKRIEHNSRLDLWL
jgi:hypothetical protein